MPDGYKGHKPGSRKEEVHKLYDSAGLDKALKHGLKVGLKEGTIRTWAKTWEKESPPAKSNPSTFQAKSAKSDFDWEKYEKEFMKQAVDFRLRLVGIGKDKKGHPIDGWETFATFKQAVRAAGKKPNAEIYARAAYRNCPIKRERWPEYL